MKSIDRQLLYMDGVRFGFAQRPDFLGPVTLTVRAGEFLTIVGPNGAGKSTLLRLIIGLLKAQRGVIELAGDPVETIPLRERARLAAFVPQQGVLAEDHTARELVLMGRFPHRTLGLFESERDHRAVEEALRITSTIELADRRMATLSGGESQRVHIAAAIAQEPRLLVLDEPTASLDIQHQLAVFSILRRLALRDGLGVVVVTHDVNLAAGFGTRVLLLSNGRVASLGEPGEVITPEVLEPVYGVKMMALHSRERPGAYWVVPANCSGEVDA